MSITNYRVRFSRKVVPGDYQSAEAEVEFAGTLDEVDMECAWAEAQAALERAKTQVLQSLGRKPAAVPDKVQVTVTPKAEAEKVTVSVDPAIETDEEPAVMSEGNAPISTAEFSAAISKWAEKLDRELIKKIREDQFGVKNTKHLPPERRAEFLAALEQAALEKQKARRALKKAAPVEADDDL